MKKDYAKANENKSSMKTSTLTNFIQATDSSHLLATGKTYLAIEMKIQKEKDLKNNDNHPMLDLFGAFNY